MLVFVLVASTVSDGRHDVHDGGLQWPERIDRLAKDGRQLDGDEEADDAEVGEVVGVADDADDDGREHAELRRQRRLQQLVFSWRPLAQDKPVMGKKVIDRLS